MQLKRQFRVALGLTVLVLVPTLAAAQAAIYKANLTGGQEVPPNASAATGFGRVIISGGNQASVSLTFSGLSGNQTAAHIHGPGAPGANGPIIFNIGSTGTTSGTFTSLPFTPTAQQLADLENGRWYLNVHSASFPDGEIRGQIIPDSTFIASLAGAQEAPAAASTATGVGRVTLNDTETQIFVNLTFSGLTSNSTAAHIHGPAQPGTNGPIVVNIGASGSTSGSFLNLLFPVTPLQVAQLKSGQLYLNVHSANFPDGEIRGQIKPVTRVLDFDSDGRAEVGVYRPGPASTWYVLNHATNALSALQFGTAGDLVTPTDPGGSGETFVTVWRPSTGTFYLTTFDTASSGFDFLQWGAAGDDPTVIADYDGDRFSDPAVWRAGSPGSQAVFHILQTANLVHRAVPFGASGSDVSVTGDYDGDRKADLAVYRLAIGTYFILRSTLGFLGQQFGDANMDALVPGDYDGDNRTDLAVFRYGGANPGTWYVWQSATGTLRVEAFGVGTDRPLPADYDGDGKTDVAVTRTQGGAYVWYILLSSSGALKVVQFGADGDYQLPRYLVR